MKDHQLGDSPISAELRAVMENVARGLDKIFNGDNTGGDRKVGFVLLTFPYGEAPDGKANYISNGANRKDICTLFREQIARFEGQPEVEGKA